jgi:hypothetical protein
MSLFREWLLRLIAGKYVVAINHRHSKELGVSK